MIRAYPKARHASFVCLFVLGISIACKAEAASFVFGTDVGGANGVINAQADRSSATFTSGSFVATFRAGPSGALLNDFEHQGLCIESSQIPGVTEGAGVGDPTKMNIIPGASPVSGQGESLTFSFDRAGILKELLFDGVKDETLEHFSLALPNGIVLTIFDSQTAFRLEAQGPEVVDYELSDLQVPNPVQAQTENDDLTGLNYEFSAGEVFTITYGEGDYSLIPDYHTNPLFPQFPNARGDGSRFQGVVVSVPEPATLLGFVAAGVTASWQRRRRVSR